MKTEYVEAFRAMSDKVLARLRQGAEDYGDESFTRDKPELVEEVMQELEDVCGWSFIIWLRLRDLRRSLEDGLAATVETPPCN